MDRRGKVPTEYIARRTGLVIKNPRKHRQLSLSLGEKGTTTMLGFTPYSVSKDMISNTVQGFCLQLLDPTPFSSIKLVRETSNDPITERHYLRSEPP